MKNSCFYTNFRIIKEYVTISCMTSVSMLVADLDIGESACSQTLSRKHEESKIIIPR